MACCDIKLYDTYLKNVFPKLSQISYFQKQVPHGRYIPNETCHSRTKLVQSGI